MKSFFTAIVASVFFAGSALAAAAVAPIIVNTPADLTVGHTVSISWTGGLAPYLVTVHNVSNPARPLLKDLGNGVTSGNSGAVNWLVDADAGSRIVFDVADAQGALGSSSAVIAHN